MPLESMPLAAGYLKAVLAADPDIGSEVRVRLHNFRGGVPLTEMARELFTEQPPDLIGFSVLGWNYRNFGGLAETYKQLKPDGIVVFGGNHVAYQHERVFREFPYVDAVVNGEGEETLPELVRHLLDTDGDLGSCQVPGLSLHVGGSPAWTTPERDRITELDTIPSPLLTGALPLHDQAGRFRYDVALMETNRGCPYKCSFCYWGGAVGQRMRTFSRERLRAELELLGYHEVPTVVLCDSNFGLLESDEEFVEDLIRTRERFGYPRALETSWAKNKSPRFHRIVRTLKRHGFKSSFTLALQTLSDEALLDMQRKNMKVNQWEQLAEWLRDEGLDCYAELIWGAPGETVDSFLHGYDRLAEKVARIAVYPMLLLPNTSYVENREVHGFVTLRGESDDFEYVLANRSSTLEENLRMQRFIFWARVLGENSYLRHIWRPARELAGLSQSDVVSGVMKHFEDSAEPVVADFCSRISLIAESPAIVDAVRSLHRTPELERCLRDWWFSVAVPKFSEEWRDFAKDLYEYEWWGRAVFTEDPDAPPAGWRAEEIADEQYYVSDPVDFSFDVAAVLASWRSAVETPPEKNPVRYRFRGKRGFHEHLDNHETAIHYVSIAERV